MVLEFRIAVTALEEQQLEGHVKDTSVGGDALLLDLALVLVPSIGIYQAICVHLFSYLFIL